MNNEQNSPSIDSELEARIVAMLLGEASEFECENLTRLMQEQPELASFQEEIKKLHGLLGDVGDGEWQQETDDWMLSPERRNHVLSTLSGEVQEPASITLASKTSDRGGAKPKRWIVRILQIAAVLFVPLLSASIYVTQRQYAAREVAARLSATRRNRDVGAEFLLHADIAKPHTRNFTDGFVSMSTEEVDFEERGESDYDRSSTSSLSAIRDSLIGIEKLGRSSGDGEVANDEEVSELVDQFNGLVREQRFEEAGAIARQVEQLTPEDELSVNLFHTARAGTRMSMGGEVSLETELEFQKNLEEADQSTVESATGGVASNFFRTNAAEFVVDPEAESRIADSVASIDRMARKGKAIAGDNLGADFVQPNVDDLALIPQSSEALGLSMSSGVSKGNESMPWFAAPGEGLQARTEKSVRGKEHDDSIANFAEGRLNENELSNRVTLQTPAIRFGVEEPTLGLDLAETNPLSGGTTHSYSVEVPQLSLPTPPEASIAMGWAFRDLRESNTSNPDASENQQGLNSLSAKAEEKSSNLDFIESKDLLRSDITRSTSKFTFPGGDASQAETPDSFSARGFGGGMASGRKTAESTTANSKQAANADSTIEGFKAERFQLLGDDALADVGGSTMYDKRILGAVTRGQGQGQEKAGPQDTSQNDDGQPSSGFQSGEQQFGGGAYAGKEIERAQRNPQQGNAPPTTTGFDIAPNSQALPKSALGDTREALADGETAPDERHLWGTNPQESDQGINASEAIGGLAYGIPKWDDDAKLPLSERTNARAYWEQLPSKPNSERGELYKSRDALANSSVDRRYREFGRDFLPADDYESKAKKSASKAIPAASLDEKDARTDSTSTFSLHVSDVSFKLAKSALGKGQWPYASTVRIEEFVNAFDYGDPLPSSSEKVACRVEQSIHPFLQQRNLMRVSMRTAAAGRASNTPLRLTFLLDNSGSMERFDRQQTVRRAFNLLSQQLQPNDQVTLISFARQPRLLADKVSGSKSDQLVQLVDQLPSEGGTNLESALQLAFEKAREQQVDDAQNRVILLTDGAVNLGNANPQSLSRMIATMRDEGIAFDAAGISAEGLNDEVLESLTRKGDGRYYLLDSPDAADSGFARQVAGALRPSAKNVKVQIQFNPKRVGRYKLLGFEKHRLAKEDFRNDKVDAAEIAADEAGVAVYQFEAKPDGEGDVGVVLVRFQDMSTGQMVEESWPIPYEPDAARLDQAASSLRVAATAALFAAALKGETLGAAVDLQTLSKLIAGLPEHDRNTKRVQQLEQMIRQARQVSEK